MSAPHTMFYHGYGFETSLPVIIVYSVVSLFTISVNLLLCVAYWRDPFRELQAVQNYYILNLGLADLIMGALSEPLLIATYWNNNNNNNNAIFFVHYLFAIISASCSLLNIMALSIVRYFAVQKPFESQNIINKRNVKISIAVIWGIAIHFALLPVAGWTDKTFQLYLYGLGCIVPTVVFTASYFMFYRAIRKRTAMIQHIGTEKKSQLLRNTIRIEKKATRTVLMVLVVFWVLWIPFLICDFAIVQCSNCRTSAFHLVRDITLSLVYFSSGINPLIYAWRIKAYRRAFLRVLGFKVLSLRASGKAENRNLEEVQEWKQEQQPEPEPE
ncbi:hypothetical protein ABFA07_000635 [Porites harrisoni]